MGLSSGLFLGLRRGLLSPMLLLCFSLLCFSSLAAADDNPTAYEALQSYNFPVGLLPKGPKGVLDYELDQNTGKFSVYLNGTCTLSVENSYEVQYKSTIEGYIAKEKLSELQGISVKLLEFWVNVIEVTRRGDDLNFSVGIASANFPVPNFDNCPWCNCCPFLSSS